MVKQVSTIPIQAYYFYSRGIEERAREMKATEIFEFRPIPCIEYLPHYITAQFVGREMKWIGNTRTKSVFAVR